MKRFFSSLITAAAIALTIELLCVYILSLYLPRVVGQADAHDWKTISLPPVKKIRLVNKHGTVQVRAVAVPETTIQANIRAYNLGRADAQTLQAYMASLVRVKAVDEGFIIVTEPDDRPENIEIRADYSVLVPEGTDIEVKECNGNIWISKGCGAVTITGRNSDIEVVEPRGAVAAESTNGRIRVSDAPAGATIKTVNGNIYAHLSGGALEAATTNGAIVTRLLSPKVTSCRLSSQNGGISVILTPDSSVAIDAVTTLGRIKTDFEQLIDPDMPNQRSLHGTIGKGDTQVQVETLNGNIWVAKDE